MKIDELDAKVTDLTKPKEVKGLLPPAPPHIIQHSERMAIPCWPFNPLRGNRVGILIDEDTGIVTRRNLSRHDTHLGGVEL